VARFAIVTCRVPRVQLIVTCGWPVAFTKLASLPPGTGVYVQFPSIGVAVL
jgi:hypothetical protein